MYRYVLARRFERCVQLMSYLRNSIVRQSVDTANSPMPADLSIKNFSDHIVAQAQRECIAILSIDQSL
jgi:hypothetical protein